MSKSLTRRSESKRTDRIATASRRLGQASPEDSVGGPAAVPLRRFLGPKYWPVWLIWAWMKLTAVVPISCALWVHERLGGAIYALSAKQRRIVQRNLELCFPELTAAEREQLCKRHFAALGAAFAECAISWCASDKHLEGHYEIEGFEYLEQALAKGKGVILYLGHFTNLELTGRPLKQLLPLFVCMYGHRSNALFDEIQRRGRLRNVHEAVPTDRVRALIGVLKRNGVVWYAPDQVHRGANSALIPFFGEPAMTNTATSKLARISGAALVPFSYGRIEGTARYRLRFLPALEHFPTDDAVADTVRLVNLLEGFIRERPEAYVWSHKRFKGRPNLPDVYAQSRHQDGAAARTDVPR